MGFTLGVAAKAADVVAELLEFAASDDVALFRLAADRDPSAVHASGLWYGRCPLSSRMALHRRTPLMVAAAFGSLNVLHLILSLSAAVDVDLRCGPDAVTALHCAAVGGSPTSYLAAVLLLSSGADPNAVDAAGRRPVDFIPTSPILSSLRSSLEAVLSNESPPLTPSSDSTSSSSSSPQEKNYPINPSIPDIKSSFYSSDEFRMFAFKIKPCSRAYSHDWTECPFVHPGENARRRDPRRFNYSCTPCTEFRRGECPKGDLCEYAHGVFECWLHPTQYRTRLCKDGGACSRRVCFFAHSTNDLRLVPNSLSVAAQNCASPRFQSEYFAANLSPMSVLSPRAMDSLHCVPSPKGISRWSIEGVVMGSQRPRHNSPAAEREKLELQVQQQKMRTTFASKLNQDSHNLKQELIGFDEPDFSWVQSLVGENDVGNGKTPRSTINEEHAVLGAWLKQMQLDQKVAL